MVLLQAAPAPTLLPALQEPTRTIRLSGIRGTIAKRMHESLRQMAQLTLFMDADLDAVVDDRERRKESGAAPSYTDYVIAAAARALGQHPLVNSQITDDGVALLPTAHVGMAVALDDGLIVPVIRDTASLDLASLSGESSRLAAAARSGSLELPDLEGGTFSVSTLGMFGVDGFTPVINPPNTAILGVGRLRDDVVLGADGRATTTKRLTLSLTWDHRAFDGAPAAGVLPFDRRAAGTIPLRSTPTTSTRRRLMFNFNDLFHTGIRVPDLDEAMAELGDGLGLTWAEARESSPGTVDPDRWSPEDPPPLHLLGRGPPAHRAAPGSAWFVLGRQRPHRRPPSRCLGRRPPRARPSGSWRRAGRSSAPSATPGDGEGFGVFTYVRPPTGLIVELVDKTEVSVLRTVVVRRPLR